MSKRVLYLPGDISHGVIPDTQVKPGVPTQHLAWIGEYIADKRPDVIVHLGDHWDMESLSTYDRGKKGFEGRRYSKCIEAGNAGMEELSYPIRRAVRLSRLTLSPWDPEQLLLRGNHENRAVRAVEEDPKLEGTITDEDFEAPDWYVAPFLDIVWRDGIRYSHYFYHPNTGRPYSGESMDARLKTIGYSFTMGHQQGRKFGQRPNGAHGLVVGSCYLHDEKYRGPQGQNEWRGIVMKREVKDGSYDPQFVSLEYLCRKYEGVELGKWMRKSGYGEWSLANG